MTAPLAAVERTALLTAALRAAETSRPDRLYDDPYAAELAGRIGPELLAEVVRVTFPPDRPSDLPSTPDYNAIRTRFLDDRLRELVDDPTVTQLVLAPAGVDSRAYRLDWPDRLRWFEMDRPAVLAYKEQRLAGRNPRVRRLTVPADLTADDWEERLTAAGYQPDQPSVWLLEGLLYYLPEERVRQLLGRIRAVAAPGSRVLADLVNETALTLPSMQNLLRVFADWGCPWVFGTDDPEGLFAAYGMTARAVQPGDPDAHYGRWPDPVPPRSEPGVRRVFFVDAECR
ncbi:SAM-dependent methyltransferase [Solwaraspora sp. WMMD406]|uniref:class I SAM-dependent methyltransferase n=1 Tax=Solwaraspora sp. WMMD406 TaxID=3016095 RepID=UPI002416148C|nr:SAM-dependent methyltransferase [Solwaraspora sp. WMMD406]MDG4767460.1 SAM-dependent methyltransferase [Solwaraspora sp. WMMD406]